MPNLETSPRTMHRWLAAALSAAMATASAGCATRYRPRIGPRISVVMSGGSLAYSRDGQVFEHGIVGSGLKDAVAGDPQATEAAETYTNRMTGGLVSDGIAILCLAGGVGLTADRARNGESIDPLTGGAFACALGGLVAAMVLLASAQPYQWDAINIYNDHVDARMMPYGGMPRAPAYRPPGPGPYWPPRPAVPSSSRPVAPSSSSPPAPAPAPAAPSAAPPPASSAPTSPAPLQPAKPQ